MLDFEQKDAEQYIFFSAISAISCSISLRLVLHRVAVSAERCALRNSTVLQFEQEKAEEAEDCVFLDYLLCRIRFASNFVPFTKRQLSHSRFPDPSPRTHQLGWIAPQTVQGEDGRVRRACLDAQERFAAALQQSVHFRGRRSSGAGIRLSVCAGPLGA